MLTRSGHPLTRVAIFVSVASTRERRRVDGTKAFAVLWRDPDTGRQTSPTYDDRRDATVALQLIEAAGGHALEAARIAEGIRKTGPSVDDVISEHIDLLTSVGPDTRKHYRRQLEAHISPSLGPYPVAAMTYRHIAGYPWTVTPTAPAHTARPSSQDHQGGQHSNSTRGSVFTQR